VVTSIKHSNIIVVCVLGVLNRGDHMDKFDCNIIVVFVLGVLNRGNHMDRFNDITVKPVHVVTSIKHS
jgi:hypothetical protein